MRIICVCLNPTIDISSEAEAIYPISKVRTHSVSISPGGGGVNVARVLSSYGVECELLVVTGGITGELLESGLESYQISTRCFHNSSPTRVAYTVLQTSNNQEYRFVPDGPEMLPEVFTDILDYMADLPLEAGDILSIGGSLPGGVSDDAYAQIAAIANDKNARVILDSSGRGLAGALGGKERFFLIKPSLNELQRLAGRKLDEPDALDYAHSMVREGVTEHVAVSMGSHGAFLMSEHGSLRLPAQMVKLHSAVGAGDSFVGGMIYYLSLGHEIESAFRYGLAAGSAAVMTPADKLCSPADADNLYQSVKDVAGI